MARALYCALKKEHVEEPCELGKKKKHGCRKGFCMLAISKKTKSPSGTGRMRIPPARRTDALTRRPEELPEGNAETLIRREAVPVVADIEVRPREEKERLPSWKGELYPDPAGQNVRAWVSFSLPEDELQENPAEMTLGVNEATASFTAKLEAGEQGLLLEVERTLFSEERVQREFLVPEGFEAVAPPREELRPPADGRSLTVHGSHFVEEAADSLGLEGDPSREGIGRDPLLPPTDPLDPFSDALDPYGPGNLDPHAGLDRGMMP